ncbi:MAG: radical SAM protein [Bryobacteraceae bacterium]
MANISLTTACNRDCAYCFAGPQRRSGVSHMSVETFEKALDFLERSGIDEARLLGGEPTLHPEFPCLAEMALQRGLRVRVFSNGLMPEPALRWLESHPPDRVAVLINVSAGAKGPGFFGRLGNRVTLGFNIQSPAFDPAFLLDLIREFGLSPSIRFGLTHPTADGSNRFLHPAQYQAVGTRLARFLEVARAAGVEPSFDCGFVPCMFPPGFPEALGPVAADIGTRCSPILDILPDGQVVCCYPLAALAREPLPERETAAALRSRFSERFSGYRRLGVFRECAACQVRESGRCNGGCLAASMQRLRPAVAAVSRVEPAAPARGWVVPYVDQPPVFWERLEHEFGRHIREVYFPLPGDVVGSGRPPQPAAQCEAFLTRSRLPRAVLVNPITLSRPVAEIAPAIIEALRRLIGEHGITSATVSNLLLAARIREALPELPLAASILMDITLPNQALMLKGICDTLVPASRIMRDLPALEALRAAFPGRIRLIVNEACLPGCPYRVQHFHEMCAGFPRPESLCGELLERQPWMRLTGAWVLPQHLHLFDGVADEWKLAGRVTLRDAPTYRKVLGAYVHRRPLAAHEIGGGPASPLKAVEIDEEFYARTLRCGRRCHECNVCREYYDETVA